MNRINIKDSCWRNVLGVDETDRLSGRGNCQEVEQYSSYSGWREIQSEEALDMGFGELVNWSKSKTNVLVGNDYHMYLNKNDFIVN